MFVTSHTCTRKPFDMGFVFMFLLVQIVVGTVRGSTQLAEIFRDDFDQVGFLDHSKWMVANLPSQVNNELQFYSPIAVNVTGGTLAIWTTNTKMGSRIYTSGRVDTRAKFDFLYGEVEWKARIPKGKGIWTALWLLDSRCLPAVPCPYWPPAVTVADIQGHLPKKDVATVVYKSAAGQPAFASSSVESVDDLSLAFHKYRVTWEKTLLVCYLDDTEILRVTDAEKIPQIRMQIVMNVAVGGDFAGSPDATTVFPTNLSIDYVVVRQKPNWTDADRMVASSGELSSFLSVILTILMPVLVFCQ